jgi:hypothetical protein
MSEEDPIGIPSTICRRCGRHLSAKRSVKNGYGPVCLRKNKAGDLTRARAIERLEPRTVTDPVWAERVIRAIYTLVQQVTPESAGWNARCVICGTTIHEMPLESFDHEGGQVLPGFGKPQWFYLHDDHNDLAIWKIRITDEMILAELERQYPGQIPPMRKSQEEKMLADEEYAMKVHHAQYLDHSSRITEESTGC